MNKIFSESNVQTPLTLKYRLIKLVQISIVASLFMRIILLFANEMILKNEKMSQICLLGVVVYCIAILMKQLKFYDSKYYLVFYLLHIETCLFVYEFISQYGFGYGFEVQLIMLIIFSYFTAIRDKLVSYIIFAIEVCLFMFLFYAFGGEYDLDVIYAKPLFLVLNTILLVYMIYKIQTIFEIGNYLRIITAENQRKYFEGKSSNDKLTEVLNIYSFKELLSVKFLANDGIQINNISFLCVNILDFKAINEQKGYAVADEILKVFAKMLKNNCENDQLIARIGGDKFIVAIFNEDENYVKKLAISIKDSTKMNQFTHFKILININIGICFANLPTFDNVNAVISEALFNMNNCKKQQTFLCFSSFGELNQEDEQAEFRMGGGIKISL